jgi:glycolate oxidase
MHPTIVYDHGDEDAAVRAENAFSDIVIMAQKLGGTASGEHGIGTIKNSLAHLEISQSIIDLQFGIKKLFDPEGILNPGRKL